MGSPRVAPEVLRVLNNNADQVVSIDVIAAATGFEEQQIQNAVNRMIAVNRIPIKVVMRGRAWQLDSGKAEKTTPLPAPTPTAKKNLPSWVVEELDRFRQTVDPTKVGRPARNASSADVYVWVGTNKDGLGIVRHRATGQLFTISEI